MFKVLVVGDSGVGKSAFIRKCVSGEFERIHIPTTQEKITEIPGFNFRICDITREEELFDGDAAIIMFDVFDRTSFKNIAKWHRDITRVCGDIPIVLCGNKVDIKGRKVKPKHVMMHRTKSNMIYYDLSVRSNFNLEEPFRWLAKYFY